MNDSSDDAAVIDQSLDVTVALGEIVMLTYNNAVSLTENAARETARRLLEAADELAVDWSTTKTSSASARPPPASPAPRQRCH